MILGRGGQEVSPWRIGWKGVQGRDGAEQLLVTQIPQFECWCRMKRGRSQHGQDVPVTEQAAEPAIGLSSAATKITDAFRLNGFWVKCGQGAISQQSQEIAVRREAQRSN